MKNIYLKLQLFDKKNKTQKCNNNKNYLKHHLLLWIKVKKKQKKKIEWENINKKAKCVFIYYVMLCYNIYICCCCWSQIPFIFLFNLHCTFCYRAKHLHVAVTWYIFYSEIFSRIVNNQKSLKNSYRMYNVRGERRKFLFSKQKTVKLGNIAQHIIDLGKKYCGSFFCYFEWKKIVIHKNFTAFSF